MLSNHMELVSTEQAQREAALAGGPCVKPSQRTSTLRRTAAALTAALSGHRPLINPIGLGIGSRPLDPTAVQVDCRRATASRAAACASQSRRRRTPPHHLHTQLSRRDAAARRCRPSLPYTLQPIYNDDHDDEIWPTLVMTT